MAVQDIEINGIIYPVVWTDYRKWQVSLPLAGITNDFVVRGLDRHGNPLPGAPAHLTVTFRGALEPVTGHVVINEVIEQVPVP